VKLCVKIWPVFMAWVVKEIAMLRTISIGSCVSIQGVLIGQQPDGKIMIVVDEKTYVGRPVAAPLRSC
jgi:hypothetical protein